MTKTEARALADAAALEHLESARHYASLNAGDWIAIESDGRVSFPAGKPDGERFIMAVPLDQSNTRSRVALRTALLATAKC
jgi:hypothetical protein